LRHFELFLCQSEKEPDKDAHLEAELRTRIDTFTLMAQGPKVHASFTTYRNWWPISMGDKVEKQLPRIVTFYNQIGMTPEIIREREIVELCVAELLVIFNFFFRNLQ